MDVTLRVHNKQGTYPDEAGGLATGIHTISLDDLPSLQERVNRGDVTFTLPSKRDDVFQTELQKAIFDLYIKNLEIIDAGVIVGGNVTGGGPNRVLYEDAAEHVATSSEFIFSHGLSLKTKMDLAPNTLLIQPDFNTAYYGSTPHDAFTIDGYTGGFGFYGYYTGPSKSLMRIINISNVDALRVETLGNTVSVNDITQLNNLTSGNRAGYKILGDGTSSYYVDHVIDVLNVTGASLGNVGIYGGGSTRLLHVDTGSVDLLNAYAAGNVNVPSGLFGVGLAGMPSAAIHAIKTSEQLRAGYDSSNYFTLTTDANGIVTMDAIGSLGKFLIAAPTQFYTGSGGSNWLPFTDAKNYFSALEHIFRNNSDVTFLTIAPTLLTFVGGVNMAFGTSTGTKFGTADTQKMGWWNATPQSQILYGDVAGFATRRDFDPSVNTITEFMDFMLTFWQDMQSYGFFGIP